VVRDPELSTDSMIVRVSGDAVRLIDLSLVYVFEGVGMRVNVSVAEPVHI